MKNTQKNNVNIKKDKKDEKSAKSQGRNESSSSIKKSDEKIEGKIVNIRKDDINEEPTERENIFLFLEFFENYNENNLEKCQEILTTIMKTEPNNTKVKEMYKMLKEEIDITGEETENEIEDEANADDLTSNKFMKINELGEYYYSDVEDESDEEN